MNWQNLNEKPGGRMGCGLFHGRAWADLDRWPSRIKAKWEWLLWQSRFCFFRIATDEEDGWEIVLAVPPFAFWFHLDAPWLWKPTVLKEGRMASGPPAPYTLIDEREFKIDFSIEDLTLRFVLWGRKWDWQKADPWWIRGVSLNLSDFFLGRAEYSTRDLDIQPAIVPMPEAAYECTVRLFESTWKRPRWRPQRLVRATVDIPVGIPHPGKGENSYDCDEDRCYSLTCPESTVEGAIARVVESVLRSRRKYGGSVNWQPAKVA